MSTALVPAVLGDQTAPAAGNADVRLRAEFLAQLIATSAQDPQTRTRRRAAPEAAVAAYAAQDRPPAPRGHTLSRSL